MHESSKRKPLMSTSTTAFYAQMLKTHNVNLERQVTMIYSSNNWPNMNYTEVMERPNVCSFAFSKHRG